MTDVIIAGIGQVPVGEHWETSLRSLATGAIQAARKDAPGLQPQAMYIGNFMAPTLSHQSNLGALLAENVGLDGIEAYTAEAATASGAAAFHLGYLAIKSGFVDVALVVGIEKYIDVSGPGQESAVTEAADYDYEAVHGATPTAQASMLMRRYLYEYQVPRHVFGEFPLIAHANAVTNPYAMYRKAIRREAYDQAEPVNDLLNMFDIAAYADGAAAVVLARREMLPDGFPHHPVRVTGSSVVTDSLALHDRDDPLAFQAVSLSTARACQQAGILPGEVDFFELYDAFSIYAVLSLEAAGFAPRGQGWKLAEGGGLSLKGKLPITTFGGCKGRGNPLSAVGVYQIVEAALQLRSQAGPNQVANPRRGLVQCLGGPASTVVTHILEA